MFTFYSFLLTIGFIILSPLFLLRKDKYASGFWQRLGYLPEFKKDSRPVVWIHCVSVGETNAARPLVKRLKRIFPEYRLIVSTTTKTGQELAQKLFADAAEVVFYLPFDWKFSVRRALQNFKPNIILIMETELWFNFIREAKHRGAAIFLVNGRLSEKSLNRYLWIPKTMKRVLRYIDLALMQGQKDAKRIMSLGIRAGKVKVTGNMKFDQDFIETESVLTKQLRQRFAFSEDAPLIVAASTHAPEEKWILEAFKKVYKSAAENLPRLLIAPRHPERFAEVAAIIEKTGFSWTKRSMEVSPDDKLADVILLDSIGELRPVFHLSDIVFAGGSLIPHGGQSVLEPAVAGNAIVTGFYTMNFAEIVKEFLANDALIQLPELDEKDVVEKLTETFLLLLRDAKLREKLAKNAVRVMQENRGAADKTVEQLKTYLLVHSNL